MYVCKSPNKHKKKKKVKNLRNISSTYLSRQIVGHGSFNQYIELIPNERHDHLVFRYNFTQVSFLTVIFT